MYWRQLTQWFGGMGIIVLAVAVLPFVGVGGLELISAEAPGPASDRLAPRVSETAKRLWMVYLGFTIVSSVALMVTGLSLYDASAHALALVSTGGFSTNADSIGAYDSVSVELVIVIGMIIGGASFTLHYQAVRGRLGAYLANSEFRLYIVGIAAATLLVSLLLVGDGNSAGASVRNALFNVVTLATSCGFGNAQGPESLGNFTLWVPAAQVILFSFMWSGGMTGSTSGGMKVLRVQVMGRLAWREMVRAQRPRVVRPIKQGSEPIDEGIVSRIAGFVLLYFIIAVASALVLALIGTDILTSLSGSVSAMGNMGPALGQAGPTDNFLVYPRVSRMILATLMLVGRLEVFPMVLVAVASARRLRHSRPTRALSRRVAGGSTVAERRPTSSGEPE
jgi:trk system potassium uptake protein TrkH